MERISREEARNFLVRCQGLNDPVPPAGHEGALRYLRRVRCIQFDPLNVVGRNPDLVLQSRVRDYRPQVLEDLLYRDRVLLDGADKELSVILTEDYPRMARVRQAVCGQLKATLSFRGSLEALDILEEIKAYIRENGPQRAAEVNIGGRAKEGWWRHRKLSSAALDYLYHSGEIGIHSKIGTQKVYDLNENLLPEEILRAADPFPTEKDFLKWYIKRRVGSVGLARNKNTGAWLGPFLSDRQRRTEILQELAEEGELLAFGMEGTGETYYLRKEDAGLLSRRLENEVAQFIAPLDNLIWDRGMAEEVFGFRYSWEVYLPAAKRRYGYYVLPVLYKDRFVARFEPERNTGKEPLRVKNWWWEPDAKITEAAREAIRDAFRRFSAYLGVEMMQQEAMDRITGK